MKDPVVDNHRRFLIEDWAQRKMESEALVALSQDAVKTTTETTLSCAVLLSGVKQTLSSPQGPYSQFIGQARHVSVNVSRR